MNKDAPVLQDVPGYNNRERYTILLFAFLGTVFDGADFAIFLFFLVPLSEYLNTTVVEVASIHAISYIIGILGGLIFGTIADRKGRRLGLALAIGTFSLFTFLTAFATDYSTLLVLRILAGIGIGGEAGIAFAYINEAFPNPKDRRGLASGLLQSMFLVGSWLAAWLYAFTSAQHGDEGWRYAFAYLGLAGIACTVSRVFMPESKVWLASQADKANRKDEGPDSSRPALGPREAGVRHMLQQVGQTIEDRSGLTRSEFVKRVVVATLLLTFSFYSAYAIITYGPAMWQSVYSLSPQSVGEIGMMAAFLGAVSYIAGGALSDVLGRRRAYLVGCLIGIVAYSLFILSASGSVEVNAAGLWTSALVLSYLAVQLGYSFFGVQGVWISELFATGIRTTAHNFVYYTGRAIGGGALPIFALMMAEGVGLGMQFVVASGIIGSIGAMLMCFFLPETKGRSL